MKLFPTLCLLALASPAVAQISDTNNLLQTFVSAFTGTSEDDARELLDTFDSCTASADNPLFQDVLRMSVNATRACSSTDVNRRNYRLCIDRAATALRLASSPYDAFATRALDDADIAALERCETSLDSSDDAIIEAYLVIAKRFVQCELALTASQRQAVLDVFKGPDQSKELMRGQLSNLCGALHFSGETHKEFVLLATMSLKNYAALFPTRRR